MIDIARLKEWKEDFDWQIFSQAFRRFRAKLGFGNSARYELYDALSVLLETGNGVTFESALQKLYDVASDEGEKPYTPKAIVIDRMLTQLSEGVKLPNILAEWAPPEEVALVVAARESGDFQKTLADAKFLIEVKQKIGMTLASAAGYPIFLGLFAMGLLLEISLFLVPKLQQSSVKLPDTLPSQLLFGLSSSVTHNGVYMLPCVLGLIGYIVWALPRQTGDIRLHLERFVPIFTIYKIVKGTSFLLTLSVLISAGIQINTAIKLMREHANPWLLERIDRTLENLSAGANLGAAFHLTDLDFPDRQANQFLQLIASSSGDNFAASIRGFAERWINRSLQQIKFASYILLGISLATIFFLMALIVLGTMSIGNVGY